MQSRNAFNYIALAALLPWLLIFNIACVGDFAPTVLTQQRGNSAKVSLPEFMQAAEDLAKERDANFTKTLSLLKDKYQMLVEKSKLHEGKSRDGWYIFHLLFASRITKEIAELVKEIYDLSNNKAALLSSILPDGSRPVKILANNTNIYNDAGYVKKLLVFLVSKDAAAINQLSIGQMHEVFSAISNTATRRLSYLALTDKLAYLQDAFSKNQSSVINLILASLEDDEAKELRTMLITEATKMAKNDPNAASNLENLLRVTENWGFGIDVSFGVNEKIITLIVKIMEADLFDSGVQGLITSLSAIISSHMSRAEWLIFSQRAFDIIANQGLRPAAWRLLNIDEPYKKVVDDLNTAYLALHDNRLVDFNTHLESAHINLLSFLDLNVAIDIKELANLNLVGGDKLNAMVSKFPANEHTLNIMRGFLFRLRQFFSAEDYVNDDYNGITLLQILAGDGFVRPLADDPNYLAEQLLVLIEFDASLNVFGGVFSKIEGVLNKIISFRGHYWPALAKVFAATTNTKAISAWAYDNREKNEVRAAFKSYLGSVSEADKINDLKEGLRYSARSSGSSNELENQADDWGLPADDEIFKARATIKDVLITANSLSSLVNPPARLQMRLLERVNEAVTDEASARLLLSTANSKNLSYFLMLLKSDLVKSVYKSIKTVLNFLPVDEAKQVLNNDISGVSLLSLLFRDRGKYNDSHLLNTIELLTEKGADAAMLKPMEFDKYIRIFIDYEDLLNKICENLSNKKIIFSWIRHVFELNTQYDDIYYKYSLNSTKTVFDIIYKNLDNHGKKEFKNLLLEQAVSVARKNKFKILLDVLSTVNAGEFNLYKNNILTFIMDKLRIRSDLEGYARPDGLIEKVRDILKQKIDEHNANYPAEIIDWNDFVKGALAIAQEKNAPQTIQMLRGATE